MLAYNRRSRLGNPPERRSLERQENSHAATPARNAPADASTRDAAAVAAGHRTQSAAGNAASRPGHRRPGSAAGADTAPAGADRPDGLGPPLGGSDDRLEVGQQRVVIMRARGIEEDHVELAVNHRADRAAAAP